MTTMNKLSLNNQIVSMRNDVRRAKLYTINKIVKNVKQLNKRHGTEEQKSKFNQKKDRLLEEINIIKKLKDDEVSKYFLTLQEDPLIILNNPKCDAQTKALAKICMNKFLSSTLFEFKKKYPNWKIEVPLLLQQLGKKTRNKFKSERIKEDSLVKNSIKISNKKSNNSQLVNTSGNNGFLVESIKKKSCNLEDLETNSGSQKFETTRIPKHTHKNKCDTDSSVDDEICESIEDSKKTVKKHKSNNESIRDKDKQEVKKEVKKVVDPFFVTADNSEYMTVATSEKQIAALTNASENTTFSTENSFSFQKSKDNKYNSNLKKFSYNENFHSKNFNSNSDTKGKLYLQKMMPNEAREVSQMGNYYSKDDSKEKLHPSWEAKKKQTNLVQFSGKKIVFSDD